MCIPTNIVRVCDLRRKTFKLTALNSGFNMRILFNILIYMQFKREFARMTSYYNTNPHYCIVNPLSLKVKYNFVNRHSNGKRSFLLCYRTLVVVKILHKNLNHRAYLHAYIYCTCIYYLYFMTFTT